MSDEETKDVKVETGVKLSTGIKVEIDLYKVTRQEWKHFVDPRGDQDSEDVFISKVSGLPVKDVVQLPEPDFRKLVSAIIKARTVAPN